MDTLKTLALAALATVAVVGLVAWVGDSDQVGGVPGVSILPVSQYPTANLVGTYATATNATLLTGDIDQENWLDITLITGSGTITLPATSSFPGIPNVGDSRTIWFRHATTSASVNLTVAAGTGMTFKNAASSTVLLRGDTDGDNTMQMTFVRKSDEDINVYLQKYED